MTSNYRAPPDELVAQWAHTWSESVFAPEERQALVKYIATQAATWGREQERAERELPAARQQDMAYLNGFKSGRNCGIANDNKRYSEVVGNIRNQIIESRKEDVLTKAKEVADAKQ